MRRSDGAGFRPGFHKARNFRSFNGLVGRPVADVQIPGQIPYGKPFPGRQRFNIVEELFLLIGHAITSIRFSVLLPEFVPRSRRGKCRPNLWNRCYYTLLLRLAQQKPAHISEEYNSMEQIRARTGIFVAWVSYFTAVQRLLICC